jgi:hypothetical protein
MSKDNTELKELIKPMQEAYREVMTLYNAEAMKFWDSLSYEDKCLAFYAVIKKMHQAEVTERGTFRYALYDVFGFDMDMYGVAMDAGYLDLHNLIYSGLEGDGIVEL